MQGFLTSAAMVLIILVNGYEIKITPVFLLLSIAGSCLGFLPYNFPCPRMFMGDVGSATLGYLLALTVVWLALVSDVVLLVPFVLLQFNYVLDTAITLFRRIWRGERCSQAHNEHFYQRLIRAGKSHTQVTLIEATLQLVVIMLLLGFPNYSGTNQVFIALLIIGIWLSFFFYAERMFRAAYCSKTVL